MMPHYFENVCEIFIGFNSLLFETKVIVKLENQN